MIVNSKQMFYVLSFYDIESVVYTANWTFINCM